MWVGGGGWVCPCLYIQYSMCLGLLQGVLVYIHTILVTLYSSYSVHTYSIKGALIL